MLKISKHAVTYKFVKSKPSRRSQDNECLKEKIKAIHRASRQTYGAPRIHAELVENGENCSRRRVARLMKVQGIMAKMKKKFQVTTRANKNAVPAPNLLQQNFTATRPNHRWVADFTYIATKEGWLYVATVLDLFSRKIVGLSMKERMTDDLVIDALNQALKHREPQIGLLHHSDRGSQYTSQGFQKELKKHGITC